MVRLISFLTIFIFVWLLFSCSDASVIEKDFTEDSFAETLTIEDKQIYNNNNLLIGNPRWIRFHPDSFLVLQEMDAQKLIKIIDLKSDNVQEIITQGKGPGEMIVAWGIEILDNDIYVFCGQLRKVIRLSVSDKRKFNILEEFNLDKGVLMFYPLNSNLFSTLSSIGDDKRLTLFDNKGKIVKKVGDFPSLQNAAIKADNDIFSSYISGMANGNKLAVACDKTDIIEIYDVTKGLLKRLHGPIGIQLSVSSRTVGGGTMILTNPSYLTYSMIVANKAEFWVGYIGLKSEKGIRPSLYELFPRQIYSFDWKGNPLRNLKFNDPIISFDMDWNNSILYTLSLVNDYPIIAYYPLDKILKRDVQ